MKTVEARENTNQKGKRMVQTQAPPAQNGATPAGSVPALVVEHLNVAYGQTRVLHDISFQVTAGERVAVVGPNGAGKSTLLKVLVGLHAPSTGRIRVVGHLHTQCSAVAYVPQRAQVDWAFPVSVWDVVMLGRTSHIGLFRSPGKRDREQVQHSLELVQMSHLARRQIGELSGGQQQRVFIARALAQEASVLLLDEPVAGLDIRAQEEVLRIVEDIHRKGVTVLVATHDLQQAADERHYEAVLLLNQTLLGIGPAHAVLTADTLTAAYGGQLQRVETDAGVLLLQR
jgi:manganese/iron transport system ATP-binding protein/manganese/zinc/iron transport system ATP- binding protein